MRPQRLLLLASTGLGAAAHAADTATAAFDAIGDGDITAGPAVLAALAIVAGLVTGFAGYRFFKETSFLGGFVAGGYGVAYALEHALSGDSTAQAVVSWLGFVVGGLIGGGTMAAVYSLAVLFVGVAGGIVWAYLFYAFFGAEVHESDPRRVFLVAAVALCILGAVAAWSFERPVLILTTSFVGAGITLVGVGYFAGAFPNAYGLAKMWLASHVMSWWRAVPGAWWGYLAAMIALFTAGMVVQFEKTSLGRRYDSHGRLPGRAGGALSPARNHPLLPM